MKSFQREVENAMKKLATSAHRASCQKFAVPRCVGVPIPRLRVCVKRGFSFSNCDEAEQWKIWDFIWRHSRQHEAQTAALLFAEKVIAKQVVKPVAAGFSAEGGSASGGSPDSCAPYKGAATSYKPWNDLKTWTNFIDNWAHSDMLSKIYSFLLERHPTLVYPVLKKWNISTNPWKRRASIVPLIYYASPRRSAPPVHKILPLVRRLLHDHDPYVQKAVGWTLRECGTLYPVATWNFLVRHARSLATVSFSYATERLTKKEKTKLKKLRDLSS